VGTRGQCSGGDGPTMRDSSDDENCLVCSTLERGKAKMIVGMSPGAERGALL
jgi:hypothetical protein